MILTKEQRRELYEAINEAFSQSDLESFIYLEFGFSLETIASGDNLQTIIIQLMSHYEKEGQASLTDFVKGLYNIRPNHEKIKCFYKRYFQQTIITAENNITTKNNTNISAKTYSFPETSRFDLYDLIHIHTKPVLATQSGLIGIAVPCESEKFRITFCERFKKKLDSNNPKNKEKVRLVDFQSLNPRFGKVDDLVLKVYRRCKDTLAKNRDVIYSIKISKELKDSSYANHFWQLLEAQFSDFTFKSRLIVFMNGMDAPIFPDAVQQFPCPKFDVNHVWTWIHPIAEHSSWDLSFWENTWMNCMNQKCHCPTQNNLKIELVYHFLEMTVKLLQDNLSDQEAFIDKLNFSISYE